jgi:hypothetical protein
MRQFPGDATFWSSIRKKIAVPRNDPLWPIIEKYVRTCAHENFKYAHVTAVFTTSTRKHYYVFIGGRGSHFCELCDTHHDVYSTHFKFLKPGKKNSVLKKTNGGRSIFCALQRCSAPECKNCDDISRTLPNYVKCGLFGEETASPNRSRRTKRWHALRIVGVDADSGDESEEVGDGEEAPILVPRNAQGIRDGAAAAIAAQLVAISASMSEVKLTKARLAAERSKMRQCR